MARGNRARLRPAAFGRRLARDLVGRISPSLLKRIQRARARKLFLHEPALGPRRLLLEPTTACNHRCLMCADHSALGGRRTPTAHIPLEQLTRLLTDMAGTGLEEVWLAGRGEPLMHPQAGRMLALIGSLGVRWSITTNGERLDQDLADHICEWGLRQLSISIDSGSRETYAQVHSAKAEERARLLGLIKHLSQRREKRPKLVASMVISKPNYREIVQFVEDTIAAGVDALVIAGMRPVPFDTGALAVTAADWARVRDDLAVARVMAQGAGVELATDHIPATEQSQPKAAWPYEQMACFIGHVFSVIDAHGSVHGCCTCQNRLGSLKENAFPEIWRSRAYQLYRKTLQELPVTGLTPPMCDCRYGCGHIPENAAIQQELGLRFSRRRAGSEFATRLDVARAVLRHLGNVLPSAPTEADFVDLGPGVADEQARRNAARLRRLGVLKGVGSLDGKPLFDPTRMVAPVELEEMLSRALAAAGLQEVPSKAVIAESRAGSAGRYEPLMKRDLEAWVAGVGARVDRDAT